MSVNLALDVPLTRLESADLIRPAANSAADRAYFFKHNLVQEMAYQALLRNDRRALHRACAEALERAYPAQLDENAALLARHYAEAGDDPKTFAYALRAGRRAARLFAQSEAGMQFDLARAVAPHAELTPEQWIELYTARGRSLELAGRYPAAVENYLELRALASREERAVWSPVESEFLVSGNPETENLRTPFSVGASSPTGLHENIGLHAAERLELAAVVALATLYSTPNPAQDLAEARRLNADALELARHLGDPSAEARVLWNSSLHAYFSGLPHESITYGEQAIALARALGDENLLAVALNDVSRAYVAVGETKRAIAAVEEARPIFERLENLPMLADNLGNSAEAYALSGDLDLAFEYAARTEAIGLRIGNTWARAFAGLSFMMILTERAEFARALDTAQRTEQLGVESGFVFAVVMARFIRVTVTGMLGALDEAIHALESEWRARADIHELIESWISDSLARLYVLKRDYAGAAAALRNSEIYLKEQDLSNLGPVFVALATAELALAEGRPADALAAMQGLVARLRGGGIRMYLSDALCVEGEAWLALGDPLRAELDLVQARQSAESMQSRLSLCRILAAQARLAHARGDDAQSRALSAEARSVIAYIANHAPAEYRELFPHSPYVQSLGLPEPA